jgi:hypothetical protein
MPTWRAKNWRGELELEVDAFSSGGRSADPESARALVDGLVWEAFTVGDTHAVRIVDEVYAALRGADRALRRRGADAVRRELELAAYSGVLRVARVEHAAYTYEAGEVPASAPPAPAPPPPVLEAPPAEPELGLDIEAQIAALKAAAADGTPFCEECERARLRERMPEAEPEPDLDIEAQVAALKAAAADGTPFCEECERARLAKAREKDGGAAS